MPTCLPADECRAWDVNELVFSGAMWPTYQKILRADFSLFDTYAYGRAGQAPFEFPITAFYATRGEPPDQDRDCLTLTIVLMHFDIR